MVKLLYLSLQIVDVMVNEVYNSLNSYFKSLSNTGYRKQRDVNSLLLYSYIQELLDSDFRGLVTEEDYRLIENALYCLYGTCLIPFPDYYNNKTKRVMYTGSMAELVHRIEKMESDSETIHEAVKTLKDKPIVVPGDEVKVVEDFVIEE